MFLVNLAYINASNGMFWYAMDKIKSLGMEVSKCVILVRPHLAALVIAEIPGASIRVVGKWQACVEIVRHKLTSRRSARVVTFTSHPLPFISGQTVAFYDEYPFEGLVGSIKRILFIFAVRTSRCRVGIINRSAAVPFLVRHGVDERRIFFDSALPVVDVRQKLQRHASPGTPLRLGLVGTDSRKKDYGAIFQAVMTLGIEAQLRFIMYGSENDYTSELRQEFRQIDFAVVSSDQVALPDYFALIDYLVSASVGEGYGRPMGLASVLGVPMFLLRSPVFAEFFSDHAMLFDDVDAMLSYIAENRPPAFAPGSTGILPSADRSPFFD